MKIEDKNFLACFSAGQQGDCIFEYQVQVVRTMKLFGIVFFCLIVYSSCHSDVCQECAVIKESNEQSIRQNLQKVNGGIIYRLEQEPFSEIDHYSIITCEIAEMDRIEALDNLTELRSFEEDGNVIRYQVKWYTNCRLIK